jgi:hypothetical protein
VHSMLIWWPSALHAGVLIGCADSVCCTAEASAKDVVQTPETRYWKELRKNAYRLRHLYMSAYVGQWQKLCCRTT